MPDFIIDFTRVIRITSRIPITARNEEAAEEKADKVVSEYLHNSSVEVTITANKKKYEDAEWDTRSYEEDVEEIEVNEV